MEKNIEKYVETVQNYVKNCYKECLREPKGKLNHPFIVPGSVYAFQLWDWDSWLTGIAIAEVDKSAVYEYEKGCILDYLENADEEGRMPICVESGDNRIFDLKKGVETNIHKPCLVQHALFVVNTYGETEWVKDKIDVLEKYLAWYEKNSKHPSGLYFFLDDFAIGVDNDPCTFYRPKRSSGSIYLNSLMYAEFTAMASLEKLLNRTEKAEYYTGLAEDLKKAINEECWDEKDGFYYSADLNLLPIDPENWLHSGAPRHWNTLPMRIGVWSGFLPLWCKIASKEQAERVVKENYLNEKTFYSPNGVRSLSKAEKMYKIQKSGNPSCWLGPIWIISNYMTFVGLLNYGYNDLAKELAEKTVSMLGKDIEEFGQMHEYYHPETGEGVHNIGFQSWNLLGYEMAEWLKNN